MGDKNDRVRKQRSEELLEDEELDDVAGGLTIGSSGPSAAYPIEHGIKPKQLNVDGQLLKEGLKDRSILGGD